MIVDEKILVNVIDKSGKIVDLHEIAWQNSVKNVSINAEQKTYLIEKLDKRDINYNALIEDIGSERMKHIEKELLKRGYIRHVID